MYSFFRMIFIFLGVWIVASSLNGFLCGICLLLAESNMDNMFGAGFLFSFVFSFPFVALVGLITFIASAGGKNGFQLFQLTLASTFICAFIAAIFFLIIFRKTFGNITYPMAISIIIAGMAGVLSFRNKIKTNE